MSYQENKTDPVKILIFIMIGAVSIVFTDLFILDKTNYKWWKSSISQSSGIPVDIVNLKIQNAQYLKNGIDLPYTVRAENALPDPLKTSDYYFPEVKIIVPEFVETKLAKIEPAIGTKESISHTEVKNIENIILNLGNSGESDELIKSVSTNSERVIPKKSYRYKEPSEKGEIAIIIDDMGLNLRSKLVEIMPAHLTLSYLPYAKNLQERTKRAAANGHELMVHIPMEPMSKSMDAGPHVLKINQNKAEIIENLNWDLSRFDGFVGVNNHMGSRITKRRTSMKYVMEYLKKRNLYFIDSRTIDTSVAAQVARDNGLAYGERDIFLDHKITPEFIHSALKKLEKKAHEQGYAIAIGHPHKETIKALKAWIPTLESKGLTLVPVSAIIHKPIENEHQISVNSSN